MKKRNLPLVLVFVMFFFASCGDGCGPDHPPVHTTLFAVMGHQDGPKQMCSGAGICSSSVTSTGDAQEVALDCSYDIDDNDQITISFTAADMYTKDRIQFNAFFRTVIATNQTNVTYSFGADYVLDQSLCSQLGITPPARIQANTPSLSLTNDGTTVTLVMLLVHN